MGAQMEIVKDSEGNSHLIFDESSLYDDSQMGDKLADFEILQVLSETTGNKEGCFVAKVRSLNNHKIYAMKKLEIANIPQRLLKNCFNELNNLKQLNNPHIVKYYKTFQEDNNIYLIMEFMNNADINGYIKAHQILNESIKEEEIWNILLQCLSALDYLHSRNLSSIGIRFNNIFMNNEQNAKIGVYSKPTENNSGIYDKKDDIYYLGKYFYAMCFSQDEIVKSAKSIPYININKKNNINYSPQLMKIIYSMLEVDPEKKYDTNKLYNIVKEDYVNKYARNTSIDGVLRCLYAFPKFTNLMLQKEEEFSKNSEKYYINNYYIKAIKALSGFEEANLGKSIAEFRRAIASDNSKLDGNKEIDPIYLLAFLLEKMHKEQNETEKQKEGNTKIQKYVINSVFNGEEEDKTNKEQMINKFVNYFHANIHSHISDLFFGFLKTKRNCLTCKTGNYSFSNFCFCIFDLTERDNNNEFNLIEDGFKVQYNYGKHIEPEGPNKVFCERCLTYQKHVEFNRYYMMSHQLIICFIRGIKFKNQSKINFDENLNLSDYIDLKNDSPHDYYLVGCIKRIWNQNNEEQYIYYSKDPFNPIWHVSNEENTFNDSEVMPRLKNQYNSQIIILFFNNKNNKQENSK